MTVPSQEQRQRAWVSAGELRHQLRALEAQLGEQAATELAHDALHQRIQTIEDELCRRDEPL